MRCVLPFVLVLLSFSAGAQAQSTPRVLKSVEFARTAKDFRSYWHRGLAEVSRYELQQSRYGELHDGEAVLVFVTEDFLTDKHVKYEFGPRDNAVGILKGLQYRRFWTGVYPYNITTTAFVPVKTAQALKVAFAQTDWCGQVWAQFNRRGETFDVETRSYFQAEADKDFQLKGVLTEDEVMTRIRLNPTKLPLGGFEAVPSLLYLRLGHHDVKVYKAEGRIETAVKPAFLAQPVNAYHLSFPGLGREVVYYYEASFPFRIVAFEETAPALFNPKGGKPETLTTRGVLKESLMLDYWGKHTLADEGYRRALGLKPL